MMEEGITRSSEHEEEKDKDKEKGVEEEYKKEG
jgi:hypothetical protein